MPHLLPIIAVILAAMLWGSTGTVQAFLPEIRDPFVVGALRLAIGALALLALAGAQRESRRAFAQLPWGPVVVAAACIAGYNLLFFTGVSGAGVGIGTAITIGSAPIWVTLYDVVIRRQMPPPRRMFGQAISIAGATLLVLSGQNESASLSGLICAALAGACYAGYSLSTSRAASTVPSGTLAASTFALAALFAAPVLFLLPLGWTTLPEAVALLLFLGVVSTGVSYALYTWGLRGVEASTAVTLALIEPLTAWVLATLLVGEDLSALKITGAALLLIGLFIVTARPARAH